MEKEQQILNSEISQLALSENFKVQSKKMGFKLVKEICEVPPEVLMGNPGFTYGWLGELADFLNNMQLLHLLQAMPGKIAYRSC